MTAMDHVFGRDAKTSGASDPSTQDRRPRGASPARDKSAPKGGKAAGRAGKFYYWSFFIHKWAGLVGAAWLAVLGLTGFLLDHDFWRWISAGEGAGDPDAGVTRKKRQPKRHALSSNRSRRPPGTSDGRPTRPLAVARRRLTTWTPTIFPDGDHPQILAIEPDPKLGWVLSVVRSRRRLYVARPRRERATRHFEGPICHLRRRRIDE